MGFEVVGYRGITYVRHTRGKRGQPRTELHRAWVLNFVEDTERAKRCDPCAANYVQQAAPGTGWFGRDVILSALNGKLFRYQNEKRVTTPTARVKQTSPQSIAANTFTILQPNAKTWDNNTMWPQTTFPTRLVCKSAGLYMFGNLVEVTPENGMNVRSDIILNGSEVLDANVQVSPGSYGLEMPLCNIMYFHLNDYIESRVVMTGSGHTAQLLNFFMLAITPEAVI